MWVQEGKHVHIWLNRSDFDTNGYNNKESICTWLDRSDCDCKGAPLSFPRAIRTAVVIEKQNKLEVPEITAPAAHKL